jgi:hypothetical protein
VRRVSHETAVGEHAVVADFHQLVGGHHHADVQERAGADADAGLAGQGEPHVGLEQRSLPHLEPTLPEGLERVALQRPARERAAPRHLPVQREPVPRERVALIEAPLLPPQLRFGQRLVDSES